MAATGPPPEGPWCTAATDTKIAGSPVTAAATPPTHALMARCQCTSLSSSMMLRRPCTRPVGSASHFMNTFTSCPSRSLRRGLSGSISPAERIASQIPSWSMASRITLWPIR